MKASVFWIVACEILPSDERAAKGEGRVGGIVLTADFGGRDGELVSHPIKYTPHDRALVFQRG